MAAARSVLDLLTVSSRRCLCSPAYVMWKKLDTSHSFMAADEKVLVVYKSCLQPGLNRIKG